MTEEKKTKIKKTITVIQIAMAAILLLYLIYGIVTKNTSVLIFNVMAVLLVAGFVILNDFVEPYLLGIFGEMDDFRRSAYRTYLLWDIASMAGLLFFVLNFTQESNLMIYGGLLVYFIGAKQKRSYQAVYMGNVTKADVEAAKASVADEKAVEIEEAEKKTEE